MASVALPNVPYNVPMLDENGFLTLAWSAFFRGLYTRVGQANALSNIELQALSSGAVFEAELTALTVTVAANQIANAAEFNDLGQGPVL